MERCWADTWVPVGPLSARTLPCKWAEQPASAGAQTLAVQEHKLHFIQSAHLPLYLQTWHLSTHPAFYLHTLTWCPLLMELLSHNSHLQLDFIPWFYTVHPTLATGKQLWQPDWASAPCTHPGKWRVSWRTCYWLGWLVHVCCRQVLAPSVCFAKLWKPVHWVQLSASSFVNGYGALATSCKLSMKCDTIQLQ